MTEHVLDAVIEPQDAVADKRPAQPLRVGVVGLGKVGARRARLTQQHPDLELCAVCDIDPELAQEYPRQEYFTDYRELIKRDDLDIVFVAAYNNIAPDAVIRALNSGKHVFCEKPPGRSVADVQRIMAAEAANPGLKLKFGFNHRYHYAILEAKAMLETGRYGKMLWMRGIYGKSGGVDFENAWRNRSDISGGGILIDQGIHMIDLLRYFGGDFTEVQSVVTTAFWNIPVEDNAFALLRTADNQVAMLHSSATQWKHRFTLEICLEKGYININGILSSTRSYGEESITFAWRQFEDQSFAFGKPREETIFFDRDDSWALEVQDFVKVIREDRPVDNGNSLDALRSMELVWQIYENGRRS